MKDNCLINSDCISEKVLACIDACLSKKAEDVVALDISGLTPIADYFIICSGMSEIQVRAIADANEDVLDEIRRSDRSSPPCRREGMGKWILVDGGDVIIHVFHEDVRRFYDIENLWADAKRLTV
ncbi:MAG: ribosome silencing factor [bacterium]|nr:ribosome silencing factor [bacterium]